MEQIALKKAGVDEAKIKADSKLRKGAGTGKLEGRLIVAEKRTTGTVSWRGELAPSHSSGHVTNFTHSLCGISASRQGLLDAPLAYHLHDRNAEQSDPEHLRASLVGVGVRPNLFVYMYSELITMQRVRSPKLLLSDLVCLFGHQPVPCDVPRVSQAPSLAWFLT